MDRKGRKMKVDNIIALKLLRGRINEKKPSSFNDLNILDDAIEEFEKLRKHHALVVTKLTNLSDNE